MRVFKAALLGVALLLAPPAWAAVDQALLEQADGLLKSGQADEAYKLLEPHEGTSAGDVIFDYLLATAALESGRPSKATFIYERILAVDASFAGVRADMGRAYFALGDYGRAKIEFEAVLSIQSLPPDLRRSVEQYVKTAEARAQAKRTVVRGYVEFGIGRDTNIGSSTDLSPVSLPAVGLFIPSGPTGRKTADNYSTLGVGGELTHRLSEQLELYIGGDYRGRGYQDHHDPNNWTADGRAGLSYSGGGWLLRGGFVAGQYTYHGNRLRESAGLTADWRTALDVSSQLTAGATAIRYTYVPAEQAPQAMDAFTGTLGWLKTFGDGTAVFNASASGGIESAKNRDDGDKKFFGPRALLQKSFNSTLGGFATAGATFSRYGSMNDLYLIRRRETLYDLTLGLTWSLSATVSLRPQVSFIRNKSNAELYSYDKTDASINLRFDF